MAKKRAKEVILTNSYFLDFQSRNSVLYFAGQQKKIWLFLLKDENANLIFGQ